MLKVAKYILDVTETTEVFHNAGNIGRPLDIQFDGFRGTFYPNGTSVLYGPVDVIEPILEARKLEEVNN